MFPRRVKCLHVCGSPLTGERSLISPTRGQWCEISWPLIWGRETAERSEFVLARLVSPRCCYHDNGPNLREELLRFFLYSSFFFSLSLLSLLLPSNLSLRDTPLLFTSLISHTPLASHPLPFISPFPPVNLFNSYSFSMKYHRLILHLYSSFLPPSLLFSSPALSLPVIPDFQIKFEMFLYWHNHNWLQYWWSRSYNIYTRFFFSSFSSALTDYCFPSVLSSSGLIGERSMFATMPNEEICWLKMVDLQPVVVTALCVRVCALVSGFIQKQWNTVCPVLNTDYMNTLKK